MVWYHYGLSRHAAEALLLSNGCDGSFLLRTSQHEANCFALSVRPFMNICMLSRSGADTSFDFFPH
uniref:SH2 domain-containing protein n=1 Tax=Denticeps clupeoides TaxID=299321 RepID=A0AAY4CAW6_9TELE